MKIPDHLYLIAVVQLAVLAILIFGGIFGATLGVHHLAVVAPRKPRLPLVVTALSVGTLALFPPLTGLLHLFFGSPGWMALLHYGILPTALLTTAVLLLYTLLPPSWSKLRVAGLPLLALIASVALVRTSFDTGRWLFLQWNLDKLEAIAMELPREDSCYQIPHEKTQALGVIGINGVESCPQHVAFTYDAFDDVPGFLFVRPGHPAPTPEGAVFGLHIGTVRPMAPRWYWFYSCGCSIDEPH